MTAVALTYGELASQISAEHRAGLSDAQSAIQHARRAGELLLQARQQIERREWLPWLTAHCPEIPERTARRYMQIGRHPELDADSVREAILKLAAPRKPNNRPRVAAPTEPPIAPSPPRGADGGIGSDREPNSAVTLDDDGAAQDWSEEDMLEHMELEEREYQQSIQKVLDADDTLSAAHAEIKRQAAEIAALKLSRNGFMNGKAAVTELLKAEQRKTERQSKLIDQLREEIASPADTEALQQQVERLKEENERLRERIAIMEESA